MEIGRCKRIAEGRNEGVEILNRSKLTQGYSNGSERRI